MIGNLLSLIFISSYGGCLPINLNKWLVVKYKQMEDPLEHLFPTCAPFKSC